MTSYEWMLHAPLRDLMNAATEERDRGHPDSVTFSPKVFLPVTRLCRDACGYCTFAQPPRSGQRAYMTPEEVLAVARQGWSAGCTEALFTLGDKPELLYPEAQTELEALGHGSTIDYVVMLCQLVLTHTPLLPHVNAGVLTRSELVALRQVTASQGLMLESSDPWLLQPGGAHADCPDKLPEQRLAVVRAAGELRIPFTSGLLVGIGEAPAARLRDLLTLRALHREHGHIQELIVQNFCAKPGTAMAAAAEPSAEDHLRVVAMARLLFGGEMNIQAPPNLSLPRDGAVDALHASWAELLNAGINDWGGLSPLTRDYVNPEKAWPHLDRLARASAAAGKALLPRLPVYPSYLAPSAAQTWLDDTHAVPVTPGSGLGGSVTQSTVCARALAAVDSDGIPRCCPWVAGQGPRSSAGDTTTAASVEQASSSPGMRGEVTVAGHAPASDMVAASTAPVVPPVRRAKWQVQLSEFGTLQGLPEPAPSRTVLRLLHRLQEGHDATFAHETLEHLRATPPTLSSRYQGLQHTLDDACVLDARPAEGEQAGGSASAGGVQPLLLSTADVAVLLRARGADARAVIASADALRARLHGNRVSYVVNRNINYTNVCTYACAFCAFSKGRRNEELRGAPYLLDMEEIKRRVVESVARGGTEVCLQGGIHPDFTGRTYLDILAACRDAAPSVHVHAFSPLEVAHGAASLGLPLADYLTRLRAAGLGSLPGTAAEVLTPRVRAALCPDKLSTEEWLEVVAAAHRAGLKTTSTIMFGHVDTADDWAEHLVKLRDLQRDTGGITEFVPLPFVHMEAPIFRAGRSRRGPTLRESLLMHAVARLALFPWINNIQASWVKLGPDMLPELLRAGCNDVGGVLMNESITRAAGASFGQELHALDMERIVRSAGREPWQRTTLYAPAPPGQVAKSLSPSALAPIQ